ncbi:MAG: histidine phosphatase family protein [Lachnospiraceae bacterium]|nr:histidine phosphatase family protein [Lachnospiraceae bacterium]
MTIYMIRHGETDLNKVHKLQGHSDIELNDYGRELARLTGQALKDVIFDYAFTSPLSRATETAKILLESNNAKTIKDKKLDLIIDERIKEISFGEFEGLSYNDKNFTIPDKTFLNFFLKPEEYNVPENGETFEEVIKRTGEFFKDLISDEKYTDKTILVSTHGCALKAILANIRNTEIKDFWGKGVHKNCAVTILKINNGEIDIDEGNVYYD